MSQRFLIWLRAVRVNQWTKNALVFLGWFFAVADPRESALALGWRPLLLVTAMAASFCLMSSAFYLLNDVSDYESDRRHPVKCHRPIAADLVSKIDAVRLALAFFATGFLYPCFLVFRHPDRTWSFAVLLIYAIMQCAYSGLLKRIPYVDVIVIAAGFVFRAVAGAAAMGVHISNWLLACAFALSLFLALCKRRHEKLVAETSRAALKGYHPVVLDVLIALTALGTVAVYATYTLAPDTIAKFGTRGLAFTAIFVALGVIRYLFLVYGRGDVGRPEKILLSDRLMWAILVGYGLCAVFAIALR